jgi:hypothetical protein
VRVDRPGKGTGKPCGFPHSPPKTGRCADGRKKTALVAAVRLFCELSNSVAVIAATEPWYARRLVAVNVMAMLNEKSNG